MKKFGLELIREWAKKKGGLCLSSEYKGAHVALKWQCHKGHVWITVPNTIRRGGWCPTCVGRNPRVEEMAAIAARRGGKLIASHIPDSKTKIEWECALKHRWFTNCTKIKCGRWCPKCGYTQIAKCRQGSLEGMQEIAKQRGGRCLSN